MKSFHFALSLSVLSTLCLSCGAQNNPSTVQEAWNWLNDPARLIDRTELRLSALPNSGAVDESQHPWSETYWPSYEGGIAARWYKKNESGFAYSFTTQAQLTEMSLEERQSLSPAEKYDLLQGRYDFPLVKSERSRTSADRPSWEGLCHGWAAAALKFREPKPIVLKNPDGIEIPFGSSDVKALILYYQGQVARAPSRFLGSRCNTENEVSDDTMRDPECRDVNAGAFHVILANQLGKLKQGFVMDKNPSLQVWNQPVFAFKSTLGKHQPPSPGASPKAVEEILVETEVTYALEISSKWEPVLGTDAQSDTTALYSYRIEIDRNGKVVGGEWLESDRPDFLWTQERGKLTGYFKQLERLL